MLGMLNDLGEIWWDSAAVIAGAVLILLVIQGIDFGSAVTYARRNPESEVGKQEAKDSAKGFWAILLVLVTVPIMWPIHLVVGIILIAVAIFNLIKDLCIWAWKELEQ